MRLAIQPENFILGGVYLMIAIFCALQIAYTRAINRSHPVIERKLLVRRVRAMPESSVEVQAMACTWCGNVHYEDDEDCPLCEVK